jgi:hypothetical protein
VCPASPEEYCCNIRAVQHPVTLVWHFQVMWSLLFGYKSSVMSFNRLSRFFEAAPRRLLALLWSMYYDDGSLQELSTSKGAGQALVLRFFRLCGFDLSEAKRQLLGPTGEFLGLQHDVSRAVSKQVVLLQPTERLRQKVIDMVAERQDIDSTTPAQASKLTGLQNFTSTGWWGRVGRGNLAPLRQRQYIDKPPWTNSLALKKSFRYTRVLFDERPCREIRLRPVHRGAIVAISDGQAEPGMQPSGGYLLVDTETDYRWGGYTTFEEDILELWGFSATRLAEGANPIALVEAAMVIVAYHHERSKLAGRRILWFLDNSSSLYAYAKGTSSNRFLEHTTQIFHLFTFFDKADIWFEFVASEQNWADGISRDLALDRWARDHGFSTRAVQVPKEYWNAELEDIFRDRGRRNLSSNFQ